MTALESFFVLYGISTVATRMAYVKAENAPEISSTILSEGLYHVTSEENCQKILESGYFKPSNFFASLGRRKTFFFAGAPDFDSLTQNVDTDEYEFHALKVKPTEDQLRKFKVRKYRDNAVAYIGKCYLDDKQVEKTTLVLDLDENGRIYSREKEEGEDYKPSAELLEKFNLAKSGKTKNFFIQLGKYLFRTIPGISLMAKDIINKILPEKKEPKLLDEGNPSLSDTYSGKENVNENPWQVSEEIRSAITEIGRNYNAHANEQKEEFKEDEHNR